MVTSDMGLGITAAEHAANIVEGMGKSTYVGATKSVSLRLPSHVDSKAKALAHKSGKTRHSTLIMLIEVGLEEVRSRLTPETLEELQAIQQELDQDDFTQFEGEA